MFQMSVPTDIMSSSDRTYFRPSDSHILSELTHVNLSGKRLMGI
jgi:hypothetical protein